MAQQSAGFAVDRFGIAAVRTRLFAADVQFCGAVDSINWRAFTCKTDEFFQWFRLCFGLGVGAETFPATFPAKAAFACAAKTSRRVKQIGRIDPDDARNQLGRDIKRQVDVLCPDCRGQTVAGVVGQFDRFTRRTERGGDQNRAEDFFLHQRIRRGEPFNQGGRIETAAFRHVDTRLMHLACGVGRHHFADRVQLNRIHDGANVDALVERVAHAQLVHARAQLVVEAICDPFLHQQARPGTAHLTLVEPDGVDQTFDRAVDIGVIKHDVRGLAAQFERQRLAAAGRCFTNLATHSG